jgi:hypothetical protein
LGLLFARCFCEKKIEAFGLSDAHWHKKHGWMFNQYS